MATIKNVNDLIYLNCREVPEMIAVETRFITQAAAKQKKNEQIFYISNQNGNFDLTRHEDRVVASQNIRCVNKNTTVGLSLQGKQITNTVTTVQQCQPFQQNQAPGTVVPLVASLTMVRNALQPTVSVPFGSSPQIQAFNLNTMSPSISLTSTCGKRIFADQLQQTDISTFNMRSIGVQCKLDCDSIEFDTSLQVAEESITSNDNYETERGNFLKFINDNSSLHKGCKECLICGEIFKSNKHFYGHMVIHQGPKVLCSKCGQVLDHKNLLPQHKCRTAKGLEKAFLQCPHHTCSVKAISRLELYDHINEHANIRVYRCASCRKAFHTGQEYLRHLLLRHRCYTSAKRSRFRIYGLESPADRSCRVRVFTLHTFKNCTVLVKTFLSQRVPKQGICKICLKYFPNKSVFNHHRIKCISKFRKRLNRKRNKTNFVKM